MTRPPRILLALLLLGPGAHLAHAQKPGATDADTERKRRAYALMQEGKARFDIGKFDDALDLFRKAYEVYPYPEALYSAGQACRMKKDYEQAIFYYRGYLNNTAAGAPGRDQVEARITEMEGLEAEQKAQAKQPPQGTLKPPVPPGGPGPAPAPVATATDRPRWYADPWAWTLVGAGVVAAGVGGYLVVDGNDLEHANLPPDDMLRITEERDDRRERAIGWTLVGVGGAALVGGIVKLALVPDAPHASVDVVLAPRFLGVRGRF
jgi:hypothetical protein